LEIRQYFDKGEYERAGKKLLYYYGPCRLSHLPDVNHYLAEYYHAIGNKEKHRFHLDKALELYNFANDSVGAGRGHCYLLLARDSVGEDPNKVIEYGLKALEISVHEPINIMVHFLLYAAYEEIGDYSAAKEHLAKYEEICRGNEPYLYQLGDQPFMHIHDEARKARIPYERWKEMTDKEQRKALIKAGRYFG